MNHRQEHYMLVHPIELHKVANMEYIETRRRNDLAETRADLRSTKLMTKAAGLVMTASLGGAIYEVGANLNEGRLLAAAGLIAGLGTLVGMRGSDVLAQREAKLTQQLQEHESVSNEPHLLPSQLE